MPLIKDLHDLDFGVNEKYVEAGMFDFGNNNNNSGGFKRVDSNFGGGFGGGGFMGRPMMMGRDSYHGGNLRPVDFNRMSLHPIVKNLYIEHPAVNQRSTVEIEQWLKKNQVCLDGPNIPRPVFNFTEAPFPEPIIQLLCMNYQYPTVIQSISWPVGLSGLDMISIAKTGSGKTLGFILPAIVHILANRNNATNASPKKGPIVLVVLPTRELAQQVEEVAKVYCGKMGLRLACLFGGASKMPQVNELRNGVDICVATPGRLFDFLEGSVTDLLRCSFLVLDEADRMLDMGFEPQIRRIVSCIRKDRQTLMFSATWPKEVQSLARSFQENPVFLNVGSMELSANHNIEQNVIVVDEYEKPKQLIDLLSEIGQQVECKTIIFVETKRKADELTSGMRRGGWPAMCIHGDKTQMERDHVMREFRSGNIPILLATDVAARGLDVTDIRYVVNYDYPKNSEDYVHRIGRTGRRDQKGTSYTFFTSANAPKARDLIKVLVEANQQIPEKLAAMANGGFYGASIGGGYGGRGFNRGYGY